MRKHTVVALVAVVRLLLSSASVEGQSMPPMSCGGALSYPGAAACRDYIGSAWHPGTAASDCTSIPGASGGQPIVGQLCDTAGVIGVCRVDQGTPNETALLFYSGQSTTLQNACQGFLKGAWSAAIPAGRCDYLAATAPGAPGTPTCKQYAGRAWTAARGEADCVPLQLSKFTVNAPCGASTIGHCTFAGGTVEAYELHYYGGDAAILAAGCEGFGGGVWTGAGSASDPLLGEAYDALHSDATVTVSPNKCDKACLDQLVATQGAITFASRHHAPTEGFVYLPGGTVDPRAYAVAARRIAEAGYFVAVIPYPGGMAIADPFRPSVVIASHPEIEHWAIGGHSLGGVAAALYADVDPLDKIEALALFAGHPPVENDLSDDPNLRVYSLLGTQDAGMDMAKWTAAKHRLPANTYYGLIKGGNHEQFGYYTDPKNDGEPLISRAQQTDIYVGATIHMLRHLGMPASESFVSPIYGRSEPQNVCARAQLEIGGFKSGDLTEAQIGVRAYDTMVEFRKGHPSLATDGQKRVEVISYAAQTANPDDITAPPIFDGEVWCKMKSQEAIASAYGFKPRLAESSCAAMNEEIVDWALGRVDWRTRRAYRLAGGSVTYARDSATSTGPDFIQSLITLTGSKTHRYALTSPKLTTPLVAPAPFGGVFYCKFWSPEAAIQFVRRAAFGF